MQTWQGPKFIWENEKSFTARVGGNMKFTVYNEKYRDILF